MNTCVWAFKRLAALDDQLGFVECSDTLAQSLLASGDVQDPRDGATAMKEMDESPRAQPRKSYADKANTDTEYDTKVLNARRARTTK